MGVLVAGVVVYLSAPNAPQLIERSVCKLSLDIINSYLHHIYTCRIKWMDNETDTQYMTKWVNVKVIVS